jgi:very-short-patch-repair endonuclease
VTTVTDESLRALEPGRVANPELQCLLLARSQFGLITLAQALALGMTRRQVELRIGCGMWDRVLPAVYRVAGVPASEDQNLMAAVLWAGDGSAASGRSAGALWGLIEATGRRPEITTHRKIRCPAVVVHRSYSLPPEDITRVRSVPVTTPTRTLLDLGASLPLKSLERALERALHRQLTHMKALTDRFEEWTRRGRPGAAAWRRLLELRNPSLKPTATDFETRMSQLTREHALPPPLRQYSIFEDDHFVARPDFAYPAEKVAIECDSEEWHRGREPWQKDMWRYNALTALGWKVLRFSWWDVTKKPDQVANRIRRVLTAQRRLLATLGSLDG